MLKNRIVLQILDSIKPILLLASLGFQTVVQAEPKNQSQINHWYLSFGGGYTLADKARGGDGFNINIGVGKILNEHFNIEIKGLFSSLGKTYIDYAEKGKRKCSTSTDSSGYKTQNCYIDDGERDDIKLAGGAVDLKYYLFRETLSPYLVGSIGLINTSSHAGNSDALGLIGELGAGVTLGRDSRIKLFTDARYRYNNNFGNNLSFGKDELHDIVVNVGIMFVL